jgi:pyruvate/2-oxoglutarate dehydrogenase complex dihydrolipoamide acyltransferase (E2) component
VPSSHTEQEAGGDQGRGGSIVQVEMPQMGVSVAEGTIVEWRKRPGDWIQADEPICDVTTDKIDVEIPSPASGRLDRILVEPGTTVDVGTALAEIDAEARPGEAHPDEHREAPSTEQDEAQSPPAGQAESAQDDDGDRARFYSPVVRRIADKHGVDLSQVSGSGIGVWVR